MTTLRIARDGVERDMTPEEEAEFLATLPPSPALSRRVVSSLAFLERFTQAERIAIRQAARVSEQLEDWLDMLRAAQEIDLDDTRTVAGLGALVAAGLLTEQRRDELLA